MNGSVGRFDGFGQTTATSVTVNGGRSSGRLGRDELGRTALHLAASAGRADIVKALLASPVGRKELNAPDAAGCTPLQRAAADGHEQIVKILLENGAQVDKQDTVHGNAALHEAAWKGYSRTVKLLAAAGAALHLTNSGGFTALHLCCQNGHNQSCRELLLAGCDPDLQNNYGDTSLHTSARYGHAGVTRILISAECRVSDQNKNGDTALHIAAAMGRRKLTRILLEAGCDQGLKNKQKETALDIAQRKGLTEITNILENTQKKAKRSKEKEIKDKSKKSKSKSKIGFKEWSPYGCHYYPDVTSFPKPRLDSLPHEPLRKGEQYYLDLAGNIRKGPVGVGYTCYCAPLFRHMEEKLERDKKELIDHIDQANAKLGHRVAGLEHRTRGQLQQMSRTAAVDRARCERRHRQLEQWVARGGAGRRSERAPPPTTPRSTLARSKSLELLDDLLMPGIGLPECKSLEELDVPDGEQNDVYNRVQSTKSSSSSRMMHNSSKSSRSGDVVHLNEPRKTVAEIVAQLQGNTPPLKPLRYDPTDLPWNQSPPPHSESSDDEDQPLRLCQQLGPMGDSNLAFPNYENVGNYNGARTRSGVYSPANDVVNHISNLRLVDSDHIERETNNDSGYSTKPYGSSKGNSPSLSGQMDNDNKNGVPRIGASSLV